MVSVFNAVFLRENRYFIQQCEVRIKYVSYDTSHIFTYPIRTFHSQILYYKNTTKFHIRCCVCCHV